MALFTIQGATPIYTLSVGFSMRIISFIEDQQHVKKIFKHLDLWDVKRKPPVCANPPEADQSLAYL
jgi:hypothetical protein